MHKFAFLVHLRSYREDLKEVAAPFGLFSEAFYRFLMSNRPIDPFIWSEVRLTPGFQEPEGYIIMVPYSGQQLIEQKRQMLPVLQKAVKLAKSKGASVVGLGALTSPVTLGGKLLAGQKGVSITNGNAYTAVVLQEQVVKAVQMSALRQPTIAIIGATGSVGSLLSQLLAKAALSTEILLLGRNHRKLALLAREIQKVNTHACFTVSDKTADACEADIIVLVTSSADQTLDLANLKPQATIIDATQPRNIQDTALKSRPDLTVVDGGLVAVDHLKTNKIGQLGLPAGISFACLAETMLLAKAGWNEDFSIGNPTSEQADTISKLAAEFSYLGFKTASDHRFGKPVLRRDSPLWKALEALHAH